MRKLLLQLDSSPHPSVFDQVVAYDAGADEIVWLNISAGDEAWAELLHAVERAARRVDVPLCVGGGVDGFERAYRTGLGMSAQKALEHSIGDERPAGGDT